MQRLLTILCLWLSVTKAYADHQQTSLELSYEGMNQSSSGAQGINDAYWHFWNLKSNSNSQVQRGNWTWGLDLSGQAGIAPLAEGRYATASAKPSVKIEGQRFTHHMELTGTSSYDSTGLERRPLVEQWDNQTLGSDDRKRYLYGAVSSDHYLAITNRSSIIAYFIASSLDRGTSIFEAYFGDVDLEYELDARTKMRIGGVQQRFISDLVDVATGGPKATLIYALSPTASLEAKGGVLIFESDSGPSETGTAGLTLANYGATSSWRIGWQRGVTRPLGSLVVTVSDVLTAKTKYLLTPTQGIEANVEYRDESWVQGFAGRTPAASASGGIRYAFEPAIDPQFGIAPAGYKFAVSFNGEYIQLKDGVDAQRQAVRLSVERVF
ncbi:MAG: hypothetical protein FJ146_11730 [Deltaproteobacteria bacterium]|nr:hypothetical protein [Deltaproteobacteria bacterium]